MITKEKATNTGNSKMYQVSTLQALALGYSRSVVTVGELLRHGDTGLGTFEDVDGEMIVIDGNCYRATDDGSVKEADADTGVPFASVAPMTSPLEYAIGGAENIDELKQLLTLKIEEGFGLNSMHVIRIDGSFSRISARSEKGTHAHHVTLKDALSVTQKSFVFENVKGSLVCVYYPDYMDGINAAGWHLHFISDDRTKGGHVFELSMEQGTAKAARLTAIEIAFPSDPAFDTYALKDLPDSDIKTVEQGKE